MKRTILFAAAMLLLATAANAQQSQPNEAYPSYIEVNGVAEREITPDNIYVNITINEYYSKGKVTVGEQEQQMIAALKSLGIDTQKNLKVSNISSLKYKRNNDAITIKHYQLLITDQALVGEVFDLLQQIGITTMLIYFDNSEIEKYRAEVRKEAIANAHTTASELAEAIGQRVGKCFYIYDSNSDVLPVMYDNAMLMRSAKAYGTAETAVEEEPLEFKTIRLEYNVQTKFVLE